MPEVRSRDADPLEILRAQVRSWLADNPPPDWRDADPSHAVFADKQRRWFRALVDGGYAVPHWPAGWPGGGRSLAEQKVIYQEMARADTPRLLLTFASTYHAAATLFECGTDEQRQVYLSAILDGEIWCQGFSEPGAGSDLAALRTRAVRDGDVYRVTGQKIWSTMAQYADRCLLLVRTSDVGPKQAGITFLLLDMRVAGVTVRSINQIQGDQEFCEIFLDDVVVPVSARIGDEGEGWRIAQVTLSSERGLTLLEQSFRLRAALRHVARDIDAAGLAEDRGTLAALGELATQIDAACAIADAFVERRIAGTERVGDASMVKNSYSRALRAIARFGLGTGGLAAQERRPITYGDLNSGNWMADYMNSFAWTIAGGSEEIQRNIIAERLLNMPREPRAWTAP